MMRKAPAFDRERRVQYVFALLIGYLILRVIFRLLYSDTIRFDDVEQLFFTQELRLGYHFQPPLYTWIQWGIFELLGTNLFSLLIFKKILLFSSYCFVYFITKEITGNRHLALLAMLLMLLIPQVVWYTYRTHSVLLLASTMASIFMFIKLVETRKILFYVLFGLCAGIGLLSKYNYLIFLGCFVGAAFSLPHFRQPLLSKKILISLMVFLVVAAPHLYWILTNIDIASSGLYKFEADVASGQFTDTFLGFKNLLLASFFVVGPLVIVFTAVFFKELFKRTPSTPQTLLHPDYPVLFKRCLWLTAFVAVTAILFFGVTSIKNHWLGPLLAFVPILLVLLLPQDTHSKKINGMIVFTFIVAAIILIVTPARTVLASHFNSYHRLNVPHAELAEKIKAHGFISGNIVTERQTTGGGNLKLFFQDSTIHTPDMPLYFPLQPSAPWLIVWDANTKDYYPRAVSRLLASLDAPVSDDMTPIYIEAPYKYSKGEKVIRLGFIIIEAP